MSKVRKILYFISDKKMSVGTAAAILALSGLASNISGVGKKFVIASAFGTQDSESGIFMGAFLLPDLIYNLIILGALSSAFIPLFMEKINSKDGKQWDYANNILNFLLICVAFLSLFTFIFAPQLIPLIMPGYFWSEASRNTESFQTAVNLTRVLTLSPIFFTISGIVSGILNSYKRFLYYALAPIFYNLSIIIFTIFFYDKINPPIYAPAIGALIGAVIHFVIQLPSAFSVGFKWKPYMDLANGDIKRTFRLMAPRSIAIGASQANLFIDTIIASFFIGGIAVINYANDIQTLPMVVFGVSVATAAFPFLSESFSQDRKGEFLKTFSWGSRRILFFIIPATVGIILLRAQIVRLIFGNDLFDNGKFGWYSTYWTAKTLGFFAIGLAAQALIPLLLKAFYAAQNTKTPLYISLVVMVVNAVLSLTLPFIPGLNLGVAGIALAFSISGFLNAALLFYYLHRNVGALDKDHKIFDSTSRLIIASLIMGIVVHYSLYFFDFFLNTQKVSGLLLQTFATIAVAAVTYFLMTYLFKCEEIEFVTKKLRRISPRAEEVTRVKEA